MTGLIIATVAAIASTVVLDGQTNGQVIRTPKGTTIVVRLETQPGTGYAWRVHGRARNLVAIGVGEVERAGDGPTVTGGVEVQVFRFRVKSRGEGTLRVVYARPWESGKPAARTFSVTVDSR